MAIPGIVGTAHNEQSSGASLSVTPPGSSASWIAGVHWWGATTDLTPPAGWTQIARGRVDAATAESNYAYYYSNTPTPGSSWSHAGSNHMAVAVVGYDGALTIDQHSPTDNVSSGATNVDSPSVTTSTGTLVVRLFLADVYNDTVSGYNFPTGHPDGQVTAVLGGGDNSIVKICHVSQPTAGATGIATWTNAGNTLGWYPRTVTIAVYTGSAGPTTYVMLRPAVVAP